MSEIKQLHFPPRKNYSLESLDEEIPGSKEAILNVFEHYGSQIFEHEGSSLESFRARAVDMINTGLIKPIYKEAEDGWEISFKMWCALQNKYASYPEMEDLEGQILDGFFEYMFSMN